MSLTVPAGDLLAARLGRLPENGMARFFQIAAERRDVLSLGVGEPDFATPAAVRDAGVASLLRGDTRYTATAGLGELRAAVAAHLRRLYGLAYRPEEVLITVGVSEGLAVALGAVLDPGDEVLVPQPCFLTYLPAVLLAGGAPVTVPTRAEDRFQVRVEALEEALTGRTKAILLNYPNNPTGAVLDPPAAEALARFAERHGLVVLSDEIYDRLTYGSPHVCLAALEGMRERTILLGGFSKAYAMTGWRLGWAAAPAALAAGLARVHQATVMCPPTTAQHAALVALDQGEEAVAAMRRTFDRRRRLVVERLCQIGLPCPEPGGAFYAFPSIAATGLSDAELADRLLEEQQVLVLPGSEFGSAGAGHVRISFAAADDVLEEALDRIGRFLS